MKCVQRARRSSWLSGSPANQSERTERVLKFASKETYIDDLMDGCRYMNAAGYCHGLPDYQGDPLEASLSCGMGIFANWLLSIYRIFTERESDIVNNTVVITRRMIDEFRCAEGWISIVRHSHFKRPLNRKSTSRNNISLHGPIFYGTPTPHPTYDVPRGITCNLAIKTPKFAYQREYRTSNRNRSSGALSLTRTTMAAKTKSMAMQSWALAGHWGLSILLLNQYMIVIN